MSAAPEGSERPAALVIRLLGAKRIAARCDLTTDAVWKWPKLGRGLIPSTHQATILAMAADQGVALTAAQIIGVAA